MHASRIGLFLVTALLTQGCRTPARYVGYGVLYPEPASFTLKGKLDASQITFDTGKAYVRRVKHRHTLRIRYQYLRFWPDGRCFWGTAAYEELDRDAVEALQIGEPGYFIIEGDNITMENFSPEYSGSYAVSRGKLIKNEDGAITIRILETRYVGGSSLSLVRTYRYPNFGSHVRIFSDFYPVDFGPLQTKPTWGDVSGVNSDAKSAEDSVN